MKCKYCELYFPRKAIKKIHMWQVHRRSLLNKGIELRIPWHGETW